jgi:hypothetical protein
MARKSRRKQGSKGGGADGASTDTEAAEVEVEESSSGESEAETAAEEAEAAEAETGEGEAKEPEAEEPEAEEPEAEEPEAAEAEQADAEVSEQKPASSAGDGLPIWWDSMEAAFEPLELAVLGPEADSAGDDALTSATSAPRAPTAQALDVVDSVDEEEASKAAKAEAATIELPLDDGSPKGDDGSPKGDAAAPMGDERLKIFDEEQASWEILEALHDDIHRLFRLGDVAGALLSMERLVTLSGREPRIDAFLDRNAERLLTVYERLFDGFDHCPELTDGTDGTDPDLRIVSKIAHVYRSIDGQRTIRDMLTSLEVPQVEVAALIHHLVRTRRARIPV